MFLCNQRYTHNKNPLKKFNCWGSLWHAAEHNTAAHSALSPVGLGRKIRRAKAEKPMNWDEDSLVSKMGKKTHKSTMQKQSITISWPICSQSSSNGNPYRTLPSSFIYDHDAIWYLPLVIWVSCPNCVPSQPLICSQHTCWWEERKKQKKPWHCVHIVVNTLLLTSTKANTTYAAMKKVDSILARPSTLHALLSDCNQNLYLGLI